MSKASGLGDQFYVGGNDLSGDISTLSKISCPVGQLDVTAINQYAHSRLFGQRDGGMDFTTFFNTTVNTPFDPVLSTLPRTDAIGTYCRGAAVGNPAACINAKQINYDPTRATDGMLTAVVSLQANSYGLEWGNQLTPGLFSVTNSLTGQNTDFESGNGNWSAITNCAISNSSAQAHTGTKSLALTSTAGGDMVAESSSSAAIATNGFAVVPGQQVFVYTWVRSAVSVRTDSIGLHFYTSGGADISTTYGSGVADTTSGWTLIYGLINVPATSAFAAVSVKVASTGAGAEVHYVDDVYYYAQPSSWDSAASASFGGQAYLQITALTGADATIAIYDSADNVTFAAVSGFTFGSQTATGGFRIVLGNTSTLRRYIRAAVKSTTGGFTALTYNVVLNKNTIAGFGT